MRFDDLNDPLDDLIGAPLRPAPTKPVPEAIQQAAFVENCLKCGGTGRYWNLGPCFSCKGKGRFEFKTSAADRAKARMGAAARAVAKEKARWDEFAAAHPAEAAWMVANTSFDFAVSMRSAVEKFGDLTEKQMAAVQRCVARQEVRNVEREQRKTNAPAIDVTKIEEAFATAKVKATRNGQMGIWTRSLPLQTGDHTVVFRPGSDGSQWESMLFVKTPDGRKLGHVKGGKWFPRFDCTEAETAAVLTCASDPHTAAKAYGKAWSRCCVCNRTLTNDGSIEAGIGPICASNYGW